MSDPNAIFAHIGFLFDTDDGSLPELRITGLTGDAAARLYARLRSLASRINDGATVWDLRVDRDTPVDTVPNAAALVVSGEAQAFHVVLQDPRLDGVALPPLGVFVFPDEITLDYRMGASWGPREISALLDLLCELRRLAPGSRVELEEHAPADARDRFADALSNHCGGASSP